MRLPAPTVIAAVLLAGTALPAFAVTAPARLGTDAGAFRATPMADETSDRAKFTAKAEAEMREWQRKFDAAAHRAKAAGKEGGAAASRELNLAWAKTKKASRDLKTASAKGWGKAKSEFDEASDRLTAEWHKVYPGDK